jgi:hypothetical protein
VEWYLILWAVAGGGIVALAIYAEEWLYKQGNEIIIQRREGDE